MLFVSLLLLQLGIVDSSTACGSYTSMTMQLHRKYEERLIGRGMSTRGTVLELWVNTDRKTWTILTVSSNGRACVGASGGGWTTMKLGKDTRQ